MKVPSPLKNLRTAALICAAAGMLIYANSLTNEFAYDDLHIITENTGIHELSGVPDALARPYWPGRFGKELGLWRPTTTLLLGLEYAVSGENPTLYHVFNVAAHGAATALVVIFLAQLITLPAAFAGGLIFALHPVHVEAVANVIGVAEVISTLFYLGALLLLLRGGYRAGWGKAVMVGLLYALAFGAKESAVTLPGAVFLVDAARRRLGWSDLRDYLKDRWRVYAVLLGVAGGMLAMREHVLGSIASPFGPLGADLLEEIPRIWTLGEVWSHYVRLMVAPLDLSADYSPDVIPISIGWHAANTVGVLLALLILVGALIAWRRPALGPGSGSARAAAFGVVWFLITISPVANVVFLSGVLLAERNLYLPSVGVAGAMGWLVTYMARRKRKDAMVALMLYLSFLGWRTWTRNPTWKDNITVFGTLIEDYPYSGRAQWVLGDLFFQQGRPSQGLVSYRAAINILGPHYQLITEISKKLIAAEYLDAAERLLLFAYNDHPEFSVAPGLIAVIESEKGNAEETERWCRIALSIDDEDPVRHHLLAWALTEQGRWAEAAEARKGAIAQGEGDYWQQWVSLAALEANAGDTAAARAALDSARVKAVSTGGIHQVDSIYVAIMGDTTAR